MKFGMSLYPFNRYQDAAAIRDVARLADELGFDTITIGQHIVVPRQALHLLPGKWYESLVLGASIAAWTERVKVFFSVLVVPYYHPVQLAKGLASLDVLSGGRLVVGVGAGWLEPEFAVLGVPFQERGARLDEALRAMKALWTDPDAAFDGRWVQFKDLEFDPMPLQKPHPPLWIGGWGKNAMRRAAELGDGLYPATAGPLDRLIGDMATMRGLLEQRGRDPRTFTFAHAIDYGGHAGPSHLEDASPIRRQPMIFGRDAGPILEHVGKAERAGFAHIGVRFPGDDHREVMDAMRQFSAEVMVPAAK